MYEETLQTFLRFREGYGPKNDYFIRYGLEHLLQNPLIPLLRVCNSIFYPGDESYSLHLILEML